MREKLLWFILKFLGVSFVLFIIWWWKIQGFYLLAFENFVELLWTDSKIPKSSIWIFSNLIPFASLMIITKGLKINERLKKLGWGILILILWHVVSVLIFFYSTSIRLEPVRILFYTLYFLSIALPFFLWLIFFRRKLKGLFALG